MTGLEEVSRHLREGWYLREGTSKAPRGYLVLEYGLSTPTAVRHVVAVVHPDDLPGLERQHPEAFARPVARCAVCGGLNPGDISHTRC